MQQVKITFTNHHGEIIREDIREIKSEHPVKRYAGFLVFGVVIALITLLDAYKLIYGG